MEKLDVNKFIPFGFNLEDVIKHPTLTKSKLKAVLKSRGIFIEKAEDEYTFPILLSTILSPLEFEEIKEVLKSKEDTPKITSRPLEWFNTEDLINVVPSSIDLKKIVSETLPRTKLIKSTSFAKIDDNPNKIGMKFSCQTNNYNSSWYRNKNEFSAEIIIEKIQEDDKVYIKIIHTSPETLSVADLGVKLLVDEFKTKQFTKPDSVVEKILYRNFNNQERVKFFLSLTETTEIFTFKGVKDIEIGPDKTTDLPAEIGNFMTGGVSDLKIKGESLHENYFLKNAVNHSYVELGGIEAVFDFSYFAGEGNCLVRFGFLGYFKKRNSNIEFSIDISNVNLFDGFTGANKDKVRMFLLQEFEKSKMIKYKSIFA